MSSKGGGNGRVFGQAVRRKPGGRGGGGGATSYQRQMGNRKLPLNLGATNVSAEGGDYDDPAERAKRAAEFKARRRAEGEVLDAKFGYARFDRRTAKKRKAVKGGEKGGMETRRGWVFNMLPTTMSASGNSDADPSGASGGGAASSTDAADDVAGPERSGVDLYFLEESGSTFKSTVLYDPYFYVLPKSRSAVVGAAGGGGFSGSMADIAEDAGGGGGLAGDDEGGAHTDDDVYHEALKSALLREYEGVGLSRVEVVHREDLDEPNHLAPGRDGRAMLKLIFDNVNQLQDVKREVLYLVKENSRREEELTEKGSFASWADSGGAAGGGKSSFDTDPLSALIDVREYDVPYLVRVCIDLEIRAGAWYTVTPNAHDTGVTLTDQDVEKKADPTFLAFDIECTKAPLKFPNAEFDSIFMISYMVNGQGYLIISRHVVGADIDDFEYTPKPAYPGPFKIYNELTEEDLIRRFLSEYQRHGPQIVVTYNGDFFDWPYLETRAAKYGLDLRTELGVERVGGGGGPGGSNNDREGEYRGRTSVHLDAFHWVQRDSYLPQGSQGLKAVTKYKLGYDPVEVDPEDMVRCAKEKPTHMASYSVSDAVATYYLYEKYVHMFIFSLCTIIPMSPEDVLRKGSGTLCEALLMVQACTKDIICPNKHVDKLEKFHDGHLLESETYIGGKVECLETGVYRSDIEYDFDMKPTAYQELIDNVDRDLTFAIEVEGGMDRRRITNYDAIKDEIIESLEMLRDRPVRKERPYVYHLDVGAMYPNIILTNRLQPSAIVDDATCAACAHHRSTNGCKRPMTWVWRGDYNPASKGEYEAAKNQLSGESFVQEGETLRYGDLPERERARLAALRLKDYAKNAYRKTKVTEEVERVDTVCMRENSFYVDTVRTFRDRRYELKKLTKVWKKKIGKAPDAASKKEAEDRELVYDSLQVAHKCILNSFYGYVMRKGARWRSMPMAGIVTKTGADLIVQARLLVEQIGRPLELDTDGIWCILPRSFPDNFYFKTDDGGTLKLEYPCVMLNADVYDKFTNHQYQTLKDPIARKYETRTENSIFFEVDGPYRAMILPASTEEGKLLKKRYAVFNEDGSLAELKGFELKRRGELELIKTFQQEVFARFLDGSSLEECYASVADVANHWMDVLDTQGESLDDDELVDLISENRSMSKRLEEYGDRPGTSQTTAKRLGEFLGAEIIKDKGLNCKFIISERPHGAPVTERAVPTAIWKAEPAVKHHFLRKWLKSPGMDEEDFDMRHILDWDYYRNRLGKTIQKIITIPAALQKISNPVPRVPHPEWLERTVRKLNDRYQQKSITSMFAVIDKKDRKRGGKGGKSKTLMITDGADSSETPSSSPAMVDIEDALGGGGNNKGPGRPIVHRSRRRGARAGGAKSAGGSSPPGSQDKDGEEQPDDPEAAAEAEAEAEAVVEERVPLSDATYKRWLARKKKIWRNKRKARRKRALSAVAPSGGGTADADGLEGANVEGEGVDSSGGVGAGGSKRARRGNQMASVQGYLRDANLALRDSEWHVVEIREVSSTEAAAASAGGASSGEFMVWVMVGTSLQKIHVTVPRTLYVDCAGKVKPLTAQDVGEGGGEVKWKSVEKHLPHNKASTHLYEVTMPEHVFRSTNWLEKLRPANDAVDQQQNGGQLVRSVYGMSTPLMLRALMDLGCVSRVGPGAGGGGGGGGGGASSKQGKSYQLDELKAVNHPDAPYLHRGLSYRRIFLYESLHPKTRTGLVAVFILEGNSGNGNGDHADNADVTQPQRGEDGESDGNEGKFKMDASCHLWVVKPGGSKGQKNISSKQCRDTFAEIVRQIRVADESEEDAEAEGETSEYACLSPSSACDVATLAFVDAESDAFDAAHRVLNSYSQANHGPTFLLLNTSKPLPQLRRAIPACTSFPLLSMPFPPGVRHNPSQLTTTRDALNWEPTAAQLCFEAYLHAGVVSYPKRIAAARYGNVPIGNLGSDDAATLYDVAFGRQLRKSRTVLWASDATTAGAPDLGCNALSLASSGGGGAGAGADDILGMGASSSGCDGNEMWGDDDDRLSPVVRRPGAYRCVCVEIDVHDLAIAAVTDAKLALASAVQTSLQGGDGKMAGGGGADGGAAMSAAGSAAPLGDEMSTAVSLPLLRGLVHSWLRSASSRNSATADDLLHHFYRLIASPDAMLHDPALHRIVHSLMKSTFGRLLGELQHLGSTVVCASFNRIVVATNKTDLFDAREYIDFVLSTIRKRGGGDENEGGLARVALQPNNYYSHYVFLDENNFGGIHFERRDLDEHELEAGGDDLAQWAMYLDENGKDDPTAQPLVPTVVSGWNIMHFLPTEIAREYFRHLIGRFSKDVYRKQVALERKANEKASPTSVQGVDEGEQQKEDGDKAKDTTQHLLNPEQQLYKYKKKLISRHFASYLTRAVGEILKDGGDASAFPRLPGSHLPRSRLSNPALEFVKTVLVVLELDPDVRHEVGVLKKSLLAQVGVQEYSASTAWTNPCASFVLPDVFCGECNESRDVDLCVLPPPEQNVEDEGDREHGAHKSWECYECGNPYGRDDIERRLVDDLHNKVRRYQVQDLRCSKTGAVATRAMTKLSDACSAALELDIPRSELMGQVRILRNLAGYYDLEWLLESTDGVLGGFAS